MIERKAKQRRINLGHDSTMDDVLLLLFELGDDAVSQIQDFHHDLGQREADPLAD